MTNTIPNVPRELLERVKSLCEYWFVRGQQQHMSESEHKTWHALGFGSSAFTELRALLSAPSPAGVDADHVEDVRVMVKAQCVVMPERWLDDKSIEQVFINSGGKWDGDRWAIEDADLHPFVRSFADPAVPAADAGLVEALDYQVLFDAIAAATSVYANGAINISVQVFRDALAAHRAKGVV